MTGSLSHGNVHPDAQLHTLAWKRFWAQLRIMPMIAAGLGVDLHDGSYGEDKAAGKSCDTACKT